MPDIQAEELMGAYCDTTRRIVVVSAYPARLQPLLAELTTRCYDVLVFRHGQEALLSSLQIDLLIADRSVAGQDPLSGMAELKTPALYLVEPAALQDEPPAHGLATDRSEAWPGDVGALLVRIEDLAGKSAPQAGPDEAAFKDIRMDLRRVTVQRDGRRVELTKTEFDILRALLMAGGGVLSRQDLMEKLWGEGYFGGSNSIDVHIKSLRKKLGDDPKNPRYIVTVRGVGYRTAD
ncbi:response regulator transcription factor [Cohnella ginsengisoli]|uniref:Response regulator transcription factor n=1 Tax=Cohnella ginsengisoli TaxID=425004 RepID=A0A9X4KE96_9BACL|nr:response regulator transcription factor [Cohnella ginsengisoli]MDG0790437.1 response regulator transcription factor [Cohnella ginsengisoli]